MALTPIRVLQRINDGNHVFKERFRFFVGSRYKLIGKLHGRIGAGKFVAVDAVCHERRGWMTLNQFTSRRGTCQFSRVSEFSVAGLDLIQPPMVFRAGNKQVNHRSTFVGLTIRIHCDAV